MDPLKISKAALTLELETFERDTHAFFKKLTKSKYPKNNQLKAKGKYTAIDVLDLGIGGTTLDESAIMRGGFNGEFDKDASIHRNVNGHPVEEIEVGNPRMQSPSQNKSYAGGQLNISENHRTSPGNIVDNESLKRRFRQTSTKSNNESRSSVMDQSKHSFASKKSFRGPNSRMDRSYTEIHANREAYKFNTTDPNNNSLVENTNQFKRFVSSKQSNEYAERVINNDSFRRNSYASPIRKVDTAPRTVNSFGDNNIYENSKIMSKIQFDDMNLSKMSINNATSTSLAHICYNGPSDELYVSTNAKLLLFDISDQKGVTLKANVKLKNASVS